MVRVNAQGAKQWERRLNAESEDELYKGVVEVGEDLLVLGKAKGISFIDTYARNGTQKSRNVLGSFEAESILLTHKNELVFGGSIERQPGVLRTDLDFNSLASKRVAIQTNQEDILITGKVNKVVELEDHNLVLIGQGSVDAENVSQGVRDFLKSLGITTFNPSMLGQGLGNLPINQDDVDTVRRVSTAFVIKMVASVGNTIRWKPLISYLDSVSLHDLTETNDGSLVVIGEYDNPFNNQDMVLIKFDKQLNLLPENLRLIGTQHNEVARNIWYDPTRNRVLFLGSGQRFDQLNDFFLGHLDF